MNNLNSEQQFFSQIEIAQKEGILSEKFFSILRIFYEEYKQASLHKFELPTIVHLFSTLLELIVKEQKEPHQFSSYHRMITSPVDYHAFGLNFIEPLIDFKHSNLVGKEVLHTIVSQIEKGENAIFLANHQTEVDPQIIELMTRNKFPSLGKEMIFVAGERVITDPTAIPFSLGRNLLCIYSKKYIDFPPEKKAEKQLHNQKTMRRMKELLDQGGIAIYVAPSGGRDRQNDEGKVKVAPFDSNSIELFYLMARHAKQKTRFYPLALKTFDLLPPPSSIQTELSEERHANFVPVHIAFGSEFSIDLGEIKDKKEKKKQRAISIHKEVEKLYHKLEALS